MTCAAEPCFACRLAGLSHCPFDPSSRPELPLMPREQIVREEAEAARELELRRASGFKPWRRG